MPERNSPGNIRSRGIHQSEFDQAVNNRQGRLADSNLRYRNTKGCQSLRDWQTTEMLYYPQRNSSMSAHYHLGNPNTSSYNDLLDALSASKLNSDRTSSLPLIQFWKPQNLASRIGSLAEALNLCSLEYATKIFEYPTPIFGKGKGKPSMTDLMILTENSRIAIEAKYTECTKTYQKIDKWLLAGKDLQNRQLVLDGWLHYIKPYQTVKGLTPEFRHAVPYQLLHRIASACHKADDKHDPVVVYHIFFDETTRRAKDKFVANIIQKDFAAGPWLTPLHLKNIRLLIMETPTERRNVKTYSKDDLGSIYLDMKTSDPFGFGETQVREIQFSGSPS